MPSMCPTTWASSSRRRIREPAPFDTSKVLLVSKSAAPSSWRRLLALVVVLVASAAMIYAQTSEHQGSVPAAPAASAAAPPPAVPGPPGAIAAPDAPGPGAPAGGPHIATPAEVEALAAGAPTTAQQFPFELTPGVAPEQGLQIKTIWAARTISVLFPQITTIGGYRQDALKWHPSGLAIDVMIPDYHSPEGIELGNQIAGFALANGKRWGVSHVIWRQKIYPGLGPGSWTADMGSETANHYDHVHIATDGGGYPTGHETYSIGTITR